jgi:hypothetical protein
MSNPAYIILEDFPEYAVTSAGEVVSLKFGKVRIKKPKFDGRYLFVCLRKDGKGQNRKVHRLVMETFRGKSDLTVNHINGNKTDNRLENLEYCTNKENTNHAWEAGLCERTRKAASVRNRGEKSIWAKLNEDQVKEILAMRGSDLTQREVAAQFGIRDSAVSRIWSGKRWKHLQEVAS